MAVWDENPAQTIQKHIDNFLKYIQTGIDIQYGSDNDNSQEPLNYTNIPIQFQGTCLRSCTAYQISGSSPNGLGGDMYFKYDIEIKADGSEMISNPVLLGGSQFFIENVDNNYYTNLWNDFNNCLYSCRIKSELADGYLYLPNDANNNNDFTKQYHLYKNDFDYTNISDTEFTGYSSNTAQQLYIEPWNVEYTISQSGYAWLHGDICTVNSHGRSVPNCNDSLSKHLATTQSPSMLFTDNNTIINNYTTYGGNTYNTNNNYNNVINTYAGDNYLVVAPVTVLANGELNFNFDDLVGALNVAVGDINDNLGYDITVPTYEDLKYSDYGDFYIEPLHQLDKLPAAPEFDGTLDLRDYPTFYGTCVSTFMNILPAAFSAALAVGFVAVVLVNRLRR